MRVWLTLVLFSNSSPFIDFRRAARALIFDGGMKKNVISVDIDGPDGQFQQRRANVTRTTNMTAGIIQPLLVRTSPMDLPQYLPFGSNGPDVNSR